MERETVGPTPGSYVDPNTTSIRWVRDTVIHDPQRPDWEARRYSVYVEDGILVAIVSQDPTPEGLLWHLSVSHRCMTLNPVGIERCEGGRADGVGDAAAEHGGILGPPQDDASLVGMRRGNGALTRWFRVLSFARCGSTLRKGACTK